MSTSALARPPRTAQQRETRRHLLIYAGIIPFVVIAVFPIYWMAITAFKQDPDLYRMDNIPFWFNMAPTLKHFQILFYQTNYGAWIINTMTISVWVALITLLTAVPAGYALARLRLPGAEKSWSPKLGDPPLDMAADSTVLRWPELLLAVVAALSLIGLVLVLVVRSLRARQLQG